MLNYKISSKPQQVLAYEGGGGTIKKKTESDGTAKNNQSDLKTEQYDVSAELKAEREKMQKKIDELNEKAQKAYAVAAADGGDLGFKRLDYDTTSDDELYAAALKGLSEKYTLKSEALSEESEQKKRALEQKKEQIGEQSIKDNAEIESRYDAAKEQAGEDAIKRGIARSSIITEILKGYDKQKLSAVDESNATLKKQIAEIDDEISSLSQKLNASIRQFDMEKAIEANEKLEKLKTARDQKNAEVAKYNNELNETLLKYGDEIRSAAAEKYQKQGDEYKNDIVVALLDYYSKLTPEQAVAHFNDWDYTKYLSEGGIQLVTNYLTLRNGVFKSA